MAQPVVPGDRISYGLTVGPNATDLWVKMDVQVQVQEDESAKSAADRAMALVDRLLLQHADELKTSLKIL